MYGTVQDFNLIILQKDIQFCQQYLLKSPLSDWSRNKMSVINKVSIHMYESFIVNI